MANSRLILRFRSVPANSLSEVSISGSDPGVWGIGTSGSSLQIMSGSGGAVQFQELSIATKQIRLASGTVTADIDVAIDVSSSASSLGGMAILPPGAICTIQSPIDQINVIESNPWSVRLS